MNSLHFAKSKVSPAHLQQGLFLSLALLITLIVVQQVVHWTSVVQTAPVNPISMIHHTPFTAVTAPATKDAALSFTSVENQAAAKEVGEMPQRQSWIF
ncbi:hypothetical protein ACCD10_03975 [Pseudomonas sp. Pseusp122]|uniref:hypothetical protein n=1 Tax=unclassified Pseudomonas TaxID=196821 RepID=UPI0039A52E70